MSLVFIWDRSKAAKNLKKHCVSFDEAREAFYDPNELTMHDERHSEEEDRFLLLGCTLSGKLVVVAFTDRGDTIRIISARRANRPERKRYDET